MAHFLFAWKYILPNTIPRATILYRCGLGFELCELDLWPLTLTDCMDLTYIIGNKNFMIRWWEHSENVWQAYRGKDGRTDRLIYSQSCVVAVINLKPASRDPAIKVSGQTSGRHADIYVMATSVHEYLTAIYSVYWSKTNARDYFCSHNVGCHNKMISRAVRSVYLFVIFSLFMFLFSKFSSVRCVIPSPVQPIHLFLITLKIAIVSPHLSAMIYCDAWGDSRLSLRVLESMPNTVRLSTLGTLTAAADVINHNGRKIGRFKPHQFW